MFIPQKRTNSCREINKVILAQSLRWLSTSVHALAVLPQVLSRARSIITHVAFEVALSAMNRSHVMCENARSTIPVIAVLTLETFCGGVTALQVSFQLAFVAAPVVAFAADELLFAVNGFDVASQASLLNRGEVTLVALVRSDLRVLAGRVMAHLRRAIGAELALRALEKLPVLVNIRDVDLQRKGHRRGEVALRTFVWNASHVNGKDVPKQVLLNGGRVIAVLTLEALSIFVNSLKVFSDRVHCVRFVLAEVAGKLLELQVDGRNMFLEVGVSAVGFSTV